ncbi:hypothetical protein ACJ6WD_40460 [Streptomyces sp. VTCC 41912]|uniref:hypothetical protein n=1 Tax=Streptomyces sp. VTCC 41912 TaxID=3383243 RepID=UPI003896EAD6
MLTMPFVVAVEPDDLKVLNRVVKDGRKVELEWLAAARDLHGTKFLRGKALSQARGEIRTEFHRLRDRGKLTGTRDLVVAREVRAELKRRRMDGEFEPVPAEQAAMPGRRVGTGPRHYHRSSADDRTTMTARMPVRLPGDLGEQLVRACHWTSAPAATALWEWQTRWGDGQEVIMREAQRRGAVTIIDLWCAMSAARPDADSLLEKAKLQDQIVTTGDIIRAAVKRATR